MSDVLSLANLEPLVRLTVADQVFDALCSRILSLELQPDTKLSEVDVARQMGVSRQPVRDAFYRLSKLGFILIRPQRATTVSRISANAVMRARFIRAAIEAETVRVACDRLTTADHAALRDLLDQQRVVMLAQDPLAFHVLDDQFHRELCERSGCGFAWELIRENKSHMDRVRFLSLAFASQDAFSDHVKILDAIEARNAPLAMQHMQLHLSRIKKQIERIRDDNKSYFANEISCFPDP